jgi:hypothetical protein
MLGPLRPTVWLWPWEVADMLLENLTVALIVFGCACFSAWRLLPARTRLRLLDAAGGSSSKGWIGRRRAKTIAQLAGSCGGCSGAGRRTEAASPGQRRR